MSSKKCIPYRKYSLLKKILAIVLCCCLFVPEASRIVAGSFCAYTIIDEDANPVCACRFNSVPFEMPQTSFPDRHKELMQQTEWQYLSVTSLSYYFLAVMQCNNKYLQFDVSLTSSHISSIFHPPCYS